MKSFLVADLKKLYIPPPDSHKGQNGKLLIIGGSHLFHAASLWALKVASRIVDMVFYSSVPENNEIVQKAKEEFRDGIVVRREDIESYIEEADCILIGPGMLRNEKLKIKNEKFVESFDNFPGEFKQRISLTFVALSKMTLLIVLVFGNEKQKALHDMFMPGSTTEVPARFYLRKDITKKALLITDQKV